MRVYHFVSSQYALSDIALRRMKIARLEDLNDPFELLAANVGGRKQLRKTLQFWKRALNDTKGLLCFSKNWENPVLWSHYAAKHYGFCLGFDLNDHLAEEVKYSRKRIRFNFNGEPTADRVDQKRALNLLLTKSQDWSYEDEVRVFVDLNKHSIEGASYFYEFSRDLTLREVILGSLCEIPIKNIRTLIDTSYDSVDVIKARLAFKWFKIVPNKKFKKRA